MTQPGSFTNARFLVGLVGLVIVALGCGAPREPLPLAPGRSMRPPGGPTVPAPPEKLPPAPWDRWREVSSFRVAVPRGGVSQHLAGDHEAEVLASKEADAYPNLGPAKRLGAGSAIVERLYLPGEAKPAVVFAMVKAGAEGAKAEGAKAEGAKAEGAKAEGAKAEGAKAGGGSTVGAAAGGSTVGEGRNVETTTGVAASSGWEFLVLGPDGKVEERGAIETCARCHAEAPHDGVFGRGL